MAQVALDPRLNLRVETFQFFLLPFNNFPQVRMMKSCVNKFSDFPILRFQIQILSACILASPSGLSPLFGDVEVAQVPAKLLLRVILSSVQDNIGVTFWVVRPY